MWQGNTLILLTKTTQLLFTMPAISKTCMNNIQTSITETGFHCSSFCSCFLRLMPKRSVKLVKSFFRMKPRPWVFRLERVK